MMRVYSMLFRPGWSRWTDDLADREKRINAFGGRRSGFTRNALKTLGMPDEVLE
jgi:hypothetical protein